MTRVMQKLSKQELQMVSQLRNAGIPLDGEVVRKLTAAGSSLSITQSGTVVQNEVFDLNNGGTGYLISLLISNDDADRTISIDHFRLEIPWDEPTFRWLPKPFGRRPSARTYRFPRGGPEDLVPEVVLNHRIGRLGRFYPGDWIDGYLLGIGEAPIPESYIDRQGVEMTLSICESRGSVIPLDITLCCRRIRASRRGLSRGALRANRFLSLRRSRLIEGVKESLQL